MLHKQQGCKILIISIIIILLYAIIKYWMFCKLNTTLFINYCDVKSNILKVHACLIGLDNGCLNKNSNPISNGLFPRIVQHPSFFLTTGERVMVLLKENRQPLSRIFIKTLQSNWRLIYLTPGKTKLFCI